MLPRTVNTYNCTPNLLCLLWWEQLNPPLCIRKKMDLIIEHQYLLSLIYLKSKMTVPLIPLVGTVIEWDNVSSSLLKLRFLSFKPFFPFFVFTISCLRSQWDRSAAILGLFSWGSFHQDQSHMVGIALIFVQPMKNLAFVLCPNEPSRTVNRFLKHCGVAHHKVDLKLKREFYHSTLW